MNAGTDSRLYKVTSLFIKSIIFIVSFIYIVYKFRSAGNNYALLTIIKNSDKRILLVTFLLLFVNWGIEAFKWKILVSSLEKITFLKALKSIFAGVTVSIFMPNRIGEFAGRIFFLDKADKVNATLKNFTGSMMQFIVTLAAGLSAIFIAGRAGYLDSFVAEGFDLWTIRLMIMITVIFLFLLLLLNRFRAKFPARIRAGFKTVFDISGKEFFSVFCLSALRYTVFMLQYYLVLKAFGISPGVKISFCLIAITFLVTSIIPSFAFTEIATRGATAGYLFGSFTNDITPVIAASFVVWIINLAVPALIGMAYIWKLKFLKAS